MSGTSFLPSNVCPFSHMKKGWIIDSGTSDHMCYDLSCFDKNTLVKTCGDRIAIPNGRRIPVEYVGNV